MAEQDDTTLGEASGARKEPTHYEVLGLEPLCGDANVIQRAALRRIERLKPYELHPDIRRRAAALQQINRISVARAALSNPSDKQRYDAELIARMGPTAPPRPAVLVVLAGLEPFEAEYQFPAGRHIAIGSGQHCDLRLGSPRLSNEHCSLRQSQGQWLLSVKDDAAEVLVDGKAGRKHLLAGGAIIEMGEFALRFIADAAGRQLLRQPKPGHIRLRATDAGHRSVSGYMMLDGRQAVIGSNRSAQWCLPDASVARTHCRVRHTDKGWIIEALAGAPVLVNGYAVTAEPLADSDVVRIGNCEVKVRIVPPEASQVMPGVRPATGGASKSAAAPLNAKPAARLEDAATAAVASKFRTLAHDRIVYHVGPADDESLLAEGLRHGLTEAQALDIVFQIRRAASERSGGFRAKLGGVARAFGIGRASSKSPP